MHRLDEWSQRCVDALFTQRRAPGQARQAYEPFDTLSAGKSVFGR